MFYVFYRMHVIQFVITSNYIISEVKGYASINQIDLSRGGGIIGDERNQ